MLTTVKLFTTGCRQAVLLAKDFRFKGVRGIYQAGPAIHITQISR